MKLSHVLAAKILITAVFWCVPLLVSPAWLYALLGIPLPEPILFPRLLGAAYLALTVVYAHGWLDLRAGHSPRGAIRAGIASNGLAAILLAWHGMAGAWDDWGWAGRAFLWASLIAAAGITVGLFVAGPDGVERVKKAGLR